jgi:hypothetical protein
LTPGRISAAVTASARWRMTRDREAGQAAAGVAAETARDLDHLLEWATWTDDDVEQMVRGLVTRMREVEAALLP